MGDDRVRPVGGVRFWASAVMMGALMTFMVGVGVKVLYDDAYLGRHGIVATAVIDRYNHDSRTGVSLHVHFVDASGRQVDAVVHDPPDSVLLVHGGTVAVRYDPGDPAGRIEPVGGERATVVMWLLIAACGGCLVWLGVNVARRVRGTAMATSG